MSALPIISGKQVLQVRSFRVSDDDVAAIDKISKRFGVTRSEVIRQAIFLLQKEYRGLNDESDKRQG